MTNSRFLIETDWLAERLDGPDISVVDGSWYLPDMNRNGAEEFEHRHIPGAVFFDIDQITDPDSPLPHTLASPQAFSKAVSKLGISDHDTIVIYDGAGLFSAPRVWWNFRLMGAQNVFILNGGLPKWRAENRPMESGWPSPKATTFHACQNESVLVCLDQMKRFVLTGETQIVDARPASRFSGQAPEPRPGVRSGHMPGARSLPASELTRDGKLLPVPELKERFSRSGLNLSNPVVTTCGSGVTAATLCLALESVGHPGPCLYDGSWSEWGSREDTEIVSDN